MDRPREPTGMLEEVRHLADSYHCCPALREKKRKEGRKKRDRETGKKKKISGQRKRRAYKRQIKTRKERK